MKFFKNNDNYLIKATDNSGENRYSRDFSLDELDKTGWNIVIQAA